MKVLLIKDVFNLGRAGEVKKVADGFARNFLIPQKMAVKATVGALRQVEKIQAAATKKRDLINEEMSGLAEQIAALELSFKAKIGETGKLYGSVTQQTIIDAVNEQLNVNLDRHQVESQPLREAGEHSVRIRLTFDLIPEIKVTIESEEEEQQDEQLDETGKKPRSEKIEDIVEAEELAAAEKAAEEETEEIVGAEDLTAAEEAVEEEISESNEQETENE